MDPDKFNHKPRGTGQNQIEVQKFTLEPDLLAQRPEKAKNRNVKDCSVDWRGMDSNSRKKARHEIFMVVELQHSLRTPSNNLLRTSHRPRPPGRQTPVPIT